MEIFFIPMNNSSNHRACQREDTRQSQRERWENCASCIHSLRTDLEFFFSALTRRQNLNNHENFTDDFKGRDLTVNLLQN